MTVDITQFSDREFAFAYPDGIEAHYWTLARNYIVWSQLRTIPQKPLNILDVGCGRGIVVAYLRKKGLLCHGVELANVNPLECVNEVIFTGMNATALLPDFRQTVNMLLFLDVIEHLTNPIDFVQDILSCYPNVKHITLTVPARKELWSNYDEFYHHLRRYDIAGLKYFAQAIRGTIVDVRYFFRLLYAPAYFFASLHRNRSVVVHPPGQKLTKLLHSVISKLCIMDYFCLPKRMYGTSLICRLRI